MNRGVVDPLKGLPRQRQRVRLNQQLNLRKTRQKVVADARRTYKRLLCKTCLRLRYFINPSFKADL